jgi:hypothetical protein
VDEGARGGGGPVRRGLWFTVFVLTAAAALLWESTTLGALSRLAPLWVLVPTTVLAGVQLAKDLGRPAAPEEGASARRRRQLRIALWIGALAGLVYLLGFLPATAAFLLLYLRLEVKAEWGSSVLLTAVIVASIFLTFQVLAEMSFPEGRLF